jgi:hypothetical protein
MHNACHHIHISVQNNNNNTHVRFLLVVFMILNNKIQKLLLNYQMSIKQMILVNYSI